jgi:hypothetical protein
MTCLNLGYITRSKVKCTSWRIMVDLCAFRGLQGIIMTRVNRRHLIGRVEMRRSSEFVSLRSVDKNNSSRYPRLCRVAKNRSEIYLGSHFGIECSSHELINVHLLDMTSKVSMQQPQFLAVIYGNGVINHVF